MRIRATDYDWVCAAAMSTIEKQLAAAENADESALLKDVTAS